MTKDEALRLIKVHDESGNIEDLVAAYNKCKEALEQPAQEPYIWELFFDNGKHEGFTSDKGMAAEYGENKLPLYTHPAPSWQGLSDDERDKIYFKTFDMWSSQVDIDYAEAIEQALKEKNHV